MVRADITYTDNISGTISLGYKWFASTEDMSTFIKEESYPWRRFSYAMVEYFSDDSLEALSEYFTQLSANLNMRNLNSDDSAIRKKEEFNYSEFHRVAKLLPKEQMLSIYKEYGNYYETE